MMPSGSQESMLVCRTDILSLPQERAGDNIESYL